MRVFKLIYMCMYFISSAKNLFIVNFNIYVLVILVINIELHGAKFLQKLRKIIVFIYTYAIKFISQLLNFLFVLQLN